VRAIELPGNLKLQELTTRRVRAWHKLISEEVSVYSANKAPIKLKAALALAAEDLEFRPVAMPGGLQRQRDKARKAVPTPDEVARLLAAARDDLEHGEVETSERVRPRRGSKVEATFSRSTGKVCSLSPRLCRLRAPWIWMRVYSRDNN
jgi:hypothetical protein